MIWSLVKPMLDVRTQAKIEVLRLGTGCRAGPGAAACEAAWRVRWNDGGVCYALGLARVGGVASPAERCPTYNSTLRLCSLNRPDSSTVAFLPCSFLFQQLSRHDPAGVPEQLFTGSAAVGGCGEHPRVPRR